MCMVFLFVLLIIFIRQNVKKLFFVKESPKERENIKWNVNPVNVGEIKVSVT